jgi:hypothetical protein
LHFNMFAAYVVVGAYRMCGRKVGRSDNTAIAENDCGAYVSDN